MFQVMHIWRTRLHQNSFWLIPLVFVIALALHGLNIGVSDDEAYYWVLAQRPALGYAFHPPMVAWWIALSQQLLDPFVSVYHPLVVRLPAFLGAFFILSLSLYWMRISGVSRDKTWKAGLGLLSFSGFFGLSWMMVPDIPLFVAWMLTFYATWRLCFSKGNWTHVAMLFGGTALSILAKFSGVFIPFSALVCLAVFRWGRRDTLVFPSIAALFLGAVVASAPILIWNAQNEWAALHFQMHGRHQGGDISWIRFGRFWLIQFIAVGPVLIFYSFRILRRMWGDRSSPRVMLSWFVGIWAIPPALIFCLQPLWAEFKPHWALVVWLPLFLEFSWAWAKGEIKWQGRIQAAYGLTLIGFVWLSLHQPVLSWFSASVLNEKPNPLNDISNDLYGWEGLPKILRSKMPGSEEDYRNLTVVASRYQTASQAALAMGRVENVVKVPRNPGEQKEWPLPEALEEERSPARSTWPRLKESVIYVADQRYNQGPRFPDSTCTKLDRYEPKRGAYTGKWIDVWKCSPNQSPSDSAGSIESR
jgi:hypothetical protein